jgi:hypothetical protein
MRLAKFMVIYGGLNDFSQQMGDLIIYDLDEDRWLDDLKIVNHKIPNLSHAAGMAVFYS